MWGLLQVTVQNIMDQTGSLRNCQSFGKHFGSLQMKLALQWTRNGVQKKVILSTVTVDHLVLTVKCIEIYAV